MTLSEHDQIRTLFRIELDNGEILPLHTEGVIVDIYHDEPTKYEIEFITDTGSHTVTVLQHMIE